MKIIKKTSILIGTCLIVGFLFLYFLFFHHSDQNSSPQTPPHIILFTLDTTRADHLGCYGYPAAKTPVLDSLAQQGVRFSNCISPAVLTLPAHCSLFTGNYPTKNGIHINGSGALSSNAVTIPEVLKDKGYKTSAFIAAFVLDARWGLKQGFDYYDDKILMSDQKQFDIGKVQRPANEVVDSASKWLKSQSTESPLFMWVHLYDPHTPYKPPEQFRRQFPETMTGYYDGEIAFMDQQIGRLLSQLDTKGILKNTLIIAVGDHGESLGEHGEQTHGYFAYQASLHVPFIIRFPNNQYGGREITEPVSYVDLMPTLLNYLQNNTPPPLHGHTLMPMIRNKKSPSYPVFSESMLPNIQYGWAAIHAIISGNEKFIDTPKAEYFDLLEDPSEQNSIYGQKPIQSKRLRNLLQKAISDFEQNKLNSEMADLDQKTLSKLASLGYTNLTHKSTTGSLSQNRADPKDKFPIYQKIETAAAYIAEEHYDSASEILENLLKDETEIPQVRLLLASIYLSQDNDPAAKQHLDIVLKNDPNHLQALIAMANILKIEGQEEKMIALCKKAISLDENNTQAYSLIGEAMMNKNQYSEAYSYLQQAFEIQPKLTQNRINLATCLIGMDRLDEAERLLQDIFQEHPDFPSLHYHLALIHHKRQNLPKAKSHYFKEIEYHPFSIPAHFNLAEIYYIQKDITAYRKEMETIIEIAPDLARGYIFLARSFLASDIAGYQRGIDLVKTGLRKAREPQLKILGYYLLADFYSRLDQKEKAAAVLQKAQNIKKIQEST